MPAAMHLTVLVSLFAVTFCADTNTSSAAQHETKLITSAVHPSRVTVTVTHHVTSSTVKPANNTLQHQTTPQQVTTTVNSDEKSSSAPPFTSPQTPNKTEETHRSHPTETPVTNQASNDTVSQRPTSPKASGSPNATAPTPVNTTSPALTLGSGNGSLASNPGLVAIICIFCIILVLVLVVATVKCISTSRSNFERLEDVPMGKVNEASPFAQYSK
ncbi:putative A-agglutinin anchorage subunit-like [Scophthalmus maximus]|uniref:Putative A-agglutinin anchorage subunit-like n=1 Tax=Scophthalmus maximus TaxID=52904 RepID=A0A2U9C299_SCOMX|nr:putative A-agglutinin anchorage subunit-like [Scophthalmus maximus]